MTQLTTPLTFGARHVGYSLAPFQLSTVIGVVLGRHVFQERDVRRRLGSAMVVAGAMLIVSVGRG